jgi:hypothetical protein
MFGVARSAFANDNVKPSMRDSINFIRWLCMRISASAGPTAITSSANSQRGLPENSAIASTHTAAITWPMTIDWPCGCINCRRMR